MKETLIKTVENLTNKYGTTDPYLLCSALSVPIVFISLPKDTDGFCLTSGSDKLIAINSDCCEARQRFSVAHELGHIILHEGINYYAESQNPCFVSGKYEREADLFATYLMLGFPCYEKLKELNIYELSKKENLPIDSVLTWANSNKAS